MVNKPVSKQAQKSIEKVKKYIKTKFDDHDLHNFIQNYHERRNNAMSDAQSSMFMTTLRSNPKSTCMSLDREMRDSRYLENYESQRKKWQKFAKMISTKVGRKSPEYSMINSSDIYAEELQKREDFDSVLDSSLQHKLNNFYGNLRLSPLDGKLNRNYVAPKNHISVGK